ncbi:MAG: glycosyltransferase [Alphaproteobacteria bacterium]|nr:glycosyltransferase [Alphaproteobacteria bacterium]MDE2111232.1 glycosyltransferase [Alphaproteobacteria bacterium]MDE2492592.1 glycosyltransferase [Alphaproteobacteria bacterium]
MPEIVVAIPTFRRPHSLARLLDAMEKIETDARLVVVVADNDSERHQGYDLCVERREKGYRWPLDPVIAPERGIAQVRNVLAERALSYGSAKFVAMLDDDEWPSPQWLIQFLRVQAQTAADALQGSILFEFESATPSWAIGFDGMTSIRRPTGPVRMLEGAGNIFLTRSCLEDLTRPWFDPTFGLTGGEDRDFFERLAAAGKRFAWADEAAAHTVVPASRTSLKWTLERAYSIGNTDMRIFLKHRPKLGARVREYGKIALALLLSPVLFVILAAVPNRAIDALRRLFRNAGKITALLGRHYNEYAVTHGE